MIRANRKTAARPLPEDRVIRLAGNLTNYVLKRSARRRTIAFQVSEDGLTVFAPARASEAVIERAIHARQDWINARLAEWAGRETRPAIRFEDGEMLMYRGAPLTLAVRDLARGVRTRTSHEPGRLLIEVDPAAEGPLRTAAVRGAVLRWSRREAETHLTPQVEAYAEALGCRVRKVIVRDQKRRWGSCDSQGVIRLNWRLIAMPDDLSAYVCAHEAAHLVEANHSPAYWAVVETLIPDWKAKRKALNEAARHTPRL